MTDDVTGFLEEREKRFGGKITWRGFSIFYGDSFGNTRERGVFVFRIGSVMYFEDFEVTPKILGIPVTPKKKVEYVKFEGSFDVSDVSLIKNVRKKDAVSFISGNPCSLKKVSAFTGFFCETVQCVELKDGSVKFFQFAGSALEKAIK